MVSPARKRRAWILLALTWVAIAAVLGYRFVSARNDAAARFDREAQEQEALSRMDKIAAEAERERTQSAAKATPDAGENPPTPPAGSPENQPVPEAGPDGETPEQKAP